MPKKKMKLATFQPLVGNKERNNYKTYDNDLKNKLQEKLGFEPIFCISAENYDDLATQAWLISSWCPQELVFFETDDYHTFNIARVLVEGVDDGLYIDEEAGTDERCLEYVVREIPKSQVGFNMVGAIRSMASELYVEKPRNLKQTGATLTSAYGKRVLEYLNILVEKNDYYKTHKVVDYYEAGRHEQPLLRVLKQLYLGYGLYRNYHEWLTLLDKGKKCTMDIGCMIKPLDIMSRYQLRIALECYRKEDGGDLNRTVESHIRLYEDLKKALQANQLKYTMACQSGKIGRNDPCFCGSGLKFKKCCGPYMING